MEENLGRDHPETLTSEMWTTVLKFQEGRPDWYYDVSYFDTYSVHLRSDAVVGSRFLWAMKMCLWVGRISLDNGRAGNALKMFDHVIRRRAQRQGLMENGRMGYRSGPDIAYAKSVELEEEFRTCEKYVDGIREKWPLEKVKEKKKEAEAGRREERSERCADLEVLSGGYFFANCCLFSRQISYGVLGLRWTRGLKLFTLFRGLLGAKWGAQGY